jgi:hypothetical protein
MAICRSSSSSSSCVAMGGRLCKLRLLGVLLVALQAVSKSPLGVLSLNIEGQWLMQWKSSLTYTDNTSVDPTQSWKASDSTPCKWTGIFCTNGSVTSIDLFNYAALNGILPQNIFGEFLDTSSTSIHVRDNMSLMWCCPESCRLSHVSRVTSIWTQLS